MKAFLPAVYPNDGQFSLTDQNTHYRNMTPMVASNNQIGFRVRFPFVAHANTPTASTNRGRGITYFKGDDDLYLTEDSYVYNGGSQDLTVTTAPGWAGNTGFNEEYLGVFTTANVSGVENLIIQNAGHTSTNASAKHGNIWYTVDGATSPSGISDANCPGNNGVSMCRGVVSLDGYLFVCDINGQIHNSNLNDITTWGASDFLTAERSPDVAVYLGKQNDHIVYIGTKSIEFFYNAGNASGSPLARRSDVSYSIGCACPNSVVEVGDVIYFVGTDASGGSKVYKLEGFSLSVVSSGFINDRIRVIERSPDVSDLDPFQDDIFMCFINTAGQQGLLLTLPSVAPGTFFIHEGTGVVCNWQMGETPTYKGNLYFWDYSLPIVSSHNGRNQPGVDKFQFTNGHVAKTTATPSTSSTPLSDLGETSSEPVAFIDFPIWDAGVNSRKKINSVTVIADSSASTTYDPITAGLRWLDTDNTDASGVSNALFATYSTAREVDINKRGHAIYRLGSTRARKFILTFNDHYGYSSTIRGIEIDYDILHD